jgi:histidine ammonia-lyase
MATHSISEKMLTLKDLSAILNDAVKLELSASAKEKIQRCRTYLDDKAKNATQPIYGINTGFGSLYNKHISPNDLGKLQDNLVKSHACGTGPEIPDEIVRLMLVPKSSVPLLRVFRRTGRHCSTVSRLFQQQHFPDRI